MIRISTYIIGLTLALLPHPSGPEFLPESIKMSLPRYKLPPVDHYKHWIDACMGTGKANCRFEYSAPITEALLLGIVAARFPGKKLEWDAKNMRVPNLPAANALLTRNYRKF